MKSLFNLAMLSFICFSITGQSLTRKGSLGVVLQSTENNLGVYATQVLKDGTAEKLGILNGDIILYINGQPYNQVSELTAATRQWRAGDKVEVNINRSGKQLMLKGLVEGKPLETSEFGEVLYESVVYDGGQLRSILEIPNGVQNPPVVFFLPGIGCGSVDYYYNQKMPIKQLVEGLVSNGFAVFRVEKPGIGDSQGTITCEKMNYTYEVKAFETALQQLRSDSRIDSNQIFLYGHSLGSITAPLLAAKTSVKGVVVWGGISSSWYEYSLRRVRDQSAHMGVDYERIDKNFVAFRPFIYDFLVKKHTPVQLAKNTDYQLFIEEYFPNGDELAYGAQHYSFVQELSDIHLSSAWKKVNCNVLAIHGEYDLEAIDELWAKRVAEIVNHYHPGKGSYEVLMGTEHGYTLVPSMEDNVQMRNDGSFDWNYLAENFNPELVKVVTKWLENRQE